MERNMSESIRSRRVAEERMAVGDLAGARRCALTAARLFPEQDELPLLLALLDVLLVLQENKDDVESKWHKILQVDPMAHVTTVRNQYRRLCLLLHPNKNKLLRTDDAFNLVTQAWKVASLKLGNSADRNSEHCSVLDEASYRALSVVDGVRDVATIVDGTSSADILFFWTICPSCKTRYEHLTIYENKSLYCSICGNAFIAIMCPLPSQLEDSICNPFMAECMGYFGKFRTGNKNRERGKSRSNVRNQGAGKMVPKNMCGDVLKHLEVEGRQVADETLGHLLQEEFCNATKKAKRSGTAMREAAARKENQKPRKSPRLMTSGLALAPVNGVLRGNRESEVMCEQMSNAKDVPKDAKEHFKGRKSMDDILDISAAETGRQRKERNSGFYGEIATLSNNDLLTGDSFKRSCKKVGTPARARGKGKHMHTAKEIMERGERILNSSRVHVNGSRTPLGDVSGKGPKHLCMQMSAGHGEVSAMIGTTEAPKNSDDRKGLSIVAAEQKYNDSNNQPDKVLENTIFQKNGLDRALISATSYTTKGHCIPLITHVEDAETCNSLGIEHAQAETYQECRLRTKLVEKLKDCVFQSFDHIDDDSLRDVQVRDIEEIKSPNHESHTVKETVMAAGEKACCYETIQVMLSITFTYPGNPPSEIIEENLGQQVQPCHLDSAPGEAEDPSFEIAVADTQFFLFDKERREDCFATGQIWAIYDDDDGMPRYYARISKVLSVQPFKVELVWLNAELNNGVSCTCGEFRLGKYVISEHVNVFSHVMRWERGSRKKIRIYPQRGDVWALYKGWSASLKAKESNYEYDIVEVLSDYSETAGITVVPLWKVDGFRTVFQKLGHEAEFSILKNELGRFSHQIPVYRLVGDETSGLLQGYMELDTAATTWIT